MKIKLFFILLFISNLTFAQLSTYEINGYVKYLFSSSKLSSASERYFDHLLHARLNTRWYPADNLKTVMEIRLRGYYGGSVEHTPNFIDQVKSKYDYLDLDAVFWDVKKSVGYGEIDRLYLDWNYHELQLTLGRQRIAWGTCWVWNPTDIFNPLNVLDFDYEELPANDAVRVQYYTGAVTKIDLAYKPAKDPYDQILTGLWSINKWDYDFNFIAGLRFKRWLAGFSWVGDILNAGFRGEVLISQAPAENENNSIPDSLQSLSSFNHSLASVSLSGDYTFPNTFYIHTELLFNNNGKTSDVFLYQQQANRLGMLSAARWSVYQEFAYDITPLIRGSIFGIINPADKSFVIVPSVNYSVITNLDFYLISFLFNGDNLTEYGEYGTTVYIRLKYSF